MGLGDFLGDILTAGVENLPQIVSAVRGPTSSQAMSFLPAPGSPLGTGTPATSVDAFIRNLIGAGPATGTARAALPQGFQPALFNPSSTGGRPSPKRVAWSFAGGQARAWTYRGRPVLFSGDLRLARRFGRIAGYTLTRKRPARRYRRRS
jgi:hypothetical protein